jgi:hypothetical protein
VGLADVGRTEENDFLSPKLGAHPRHR